MARSITESAAKKFYETGVNLDIPASVKINRNCIPRVVPVKKKDKKTQADVVCGFRTRFKFFQNARKDIKTKGGYKRGKGKTRQLHLYKTKKEAEANMYRDIYAFLMAKSPRTTPEAMQRKKQATAVRERDRRQRLRESGNDPVFARQEKNIEEAAQALSVQTRMSQTLRRRATLRKKRKPKLTGENAKPPNKQPRKSETQQLKRHLVKKNDKLATAIEALAKGTDEIEILQKEHRALLSKSTDEIVTIITSDADTLHENENKSEDAPDGGSKDEPSDGGSGNQENDARKAMYQLSIASLSEKAYDRLLWHMNVVLLLRIHFNELLREHIEELQHYNVGDPTPKYPTFSQVYKRTFDPNRPCRQFSAQYVKNPHESTAREWWRQWDEHHTFVIPKFEQQSKTSWCVTCNIDAATTMLQRASSVHAPIVVSLMFPNTFYRPGFRTNEREMSLSSR